MAVGATIFVLFREPPPASRVGQLDGLIEHCTGARRAERTDEYERLVVVDEADEYVDVGSDGMLIYYADPRVAAPREALINNVFVSIGLSN
ncbi:hypothetical protein LA345_36760 (plasmid) [Burkholderia vietnamiensis]|uniref:Uncharacterized protein n=1 Tax=Burkholderia vietnamiensis (strain G4 / LMG 22486) TaxID=269482 RepID=A4JVX3_BURVG|nr:hypothetical protein Bcep1808_7551 [Burkholderia vietnamiensis G4]MCB4349365.1 hypothetical protein [Burkholderia vietnamiensis]